MSLLRVLAFVDEPALARGLADLLNGQPDIELRCVSELPTLLDALELETPSLILLNLIPAIHMKTIRTITAHAHGAPVVLWLRSVDADFACEMVRAGVHGLLRRTLPDDLLLRCLRKVEEGELWIDKSIARQLIERKPLRLTPREWDVVDGLAQGLHNKEIAGQLNLTEASVKVYVSRLLKKLSLKDRFELALYGLKHSGTVALESGMVPAESGPTVLHVARTA